MPHRLEMTPPARTSTSASDRARVAKAPYGRVLEQLCRAGWREVKISLFPRETPRPLWQVSGWNGEATIWAEAESLDRALRDLARKARGAGRGTAE